MCLPFLFDLLTTEHQFSQSLYSEPCNLIKQNVKHCLKSFKLQNIFGGETGGKILGNTSPPELNQREVYLKPIFGGADSLDES